MSSSASIDAIGPVAYNPIVLTPGDIQMEGRTYRNVSGKPVTFFFDPVIKSGIAKFEVHSVNNLYGVGITIDTLEIGPNECPWDKQKQKFT
ncbi:MAG: hypothetical protein EZS28_042868 [Streblomastix strix]|uniref:Uncharacterized protein n=1 Tax=Streblomastix strix TaxID=222440 RepID=A0A5J4TW52_9EUKA|nr:MAG: hypothetical protein EZS28_042868 [Streblomastix strix]